MATAPPALQPPPGATENDRTPRDGLSTESRRHIRGSSLLLVGKVLSAGTNFGIQIMIVRYLAKADYGAYAYALAIVSAGQSVAVLGLDRAISRFLPIYDERGEHGKLLGTLLMVAGTIAGVGLAFVLFVASLRDLVAGGIGDGRHATAVLLILILLAPIQALDDMLMGAFAVFSKARAIFFRKHVLGPMLRLAAVTAVILNNGDVRALAAAAVSAAALGVTIYGAMLVATLRRDGVLRRMRASRIEVPVREVFGFAFPLLAVDALFMLQNTANVVMLAQFGSAADVADYRAVQPAAHLNVLVMTSFTLLFTPLASRLFARGDRAGVNELYWRTAIWIAVCSFPMFAATFAVAGPITIGMFGARYEGSGTILALLALGYYCNAALGFNGLTLRVYGLVRYVVVISVVAAVLNVLLNLVLIPSHGAVGAAIATAGTMIGHNILKQAGLRRGTGISVFDRRHGRVYVVIIAATALLLVAQRTLSPGPLLAIALVTVVSAAVVVLTRRSLRVGDMFPELLQVPILRRLVAER
jgi:O-antigen/teichoic acid export membrane protein